MTARVRLLVMAAALISGFVLMSLLLSSCTVIGGDKVTYYRPDGSIDHVEEAGTQRAFLHLPTTSNVQGVSLDGFYARVSADPTNLLLLGYGGITQVNAPTDSDVEVDAGLKTDAQGNTIGFDRRTLVGQYERDGGVDEAGLLVTTPNGGP